jgi:hypothetical protein
MIVRVTCTACLALLVAETDRLRNDDVAAVQEHCQREHGLDVPALPLPDVVALIQIEVAG